MMRRSVIVAVAALSVVAGLVIGHAGGTPVASVRAAAPAGCAPTAALPTGDAAKLAHGRGLWAIAGGRLVAAESGLQVQSSLPEGVSIRHVATAFGRGTAYVVDRTGGDQVVAITSRGTRRIDEDAEATHPTWSPRGDLAWATGSGVAVLDRTLRGIHRIDGPIAGATVFSPVYVAGGRLAVTVSTPASGSSPHAASLDNLWVSTREGWRRLTRFRTSGDRWVTIRTPMSIDDGLHFVRIVGRASATREPRYELWRGDGAGVRRVRTLPGERYLAGSRAGRPIWNVPDAAGNRDLLVVVRRGGQRTIGCGAVMADPIDAIDPDRSVTSGSNVPARGHWPELERRSVDDLEQIGVIVGDFTTEAEAEEVVTAITAAYPGGHALVVDSSRAPLAIRPGVFGALLHLPASADATAALADFRDRLPEYASNSWIVTP